jgi:ribonucleoside-diphosphate reductase alpha chain
MKERPDQLETITVKKRTGCGTMYITYTHPESEYHEIFAILGKTGGCAACNISSLTRLMTVAWNSGASLKKLVKQIDGALCPHAGGLDLSCPQAIADVLKETHLVKKETFNA